MLEIGMQVKDIKLIDDSGKETNLSDFRGNKLVVYFYPKNNTTGCNKQACTFRDNYHLYDDRSTTVIGISKDTPESHKNFQAKFGLPFKTYSDSNFEIAKYFGAYGKKKMFGKTYYGMNRSTYVIDEDGILRGIIPKASPTNNALKVIEIIDSI